MRALLIAAALAFATPVLSAVPLSLSDEDLAFERMAEFQDAIATGDLLPDADPAVWHRITFTQQTLTACLDTPGHQSTFCVHALDEGEQGPPEMCRREEGRLACWTDTGAATQMDEPTWIRVIENNLTRSDCMDVPVEQEIICTNTITREDMVQLHPKN